MGLQNITTIEECNKKLVYNPIREKKKLYPVIDDEWIPTIKKPLPEEFQSKFLALNFH